MNEKKLSGIPFMKMQGAGNDFIVINNMELHLPTQSFPQMAQRVCQNRISLGGDALMLVDTPTQGGDLKMRFYNADGTEGEMCGNGVRCLARYAYEKGLAGEEMSIETLSGLVYAWRQNRREYKVRLNDATKIELERNLAVGETVYRCAYVELGNPPLPHLVVPMMGLAEKTLDEMRPLAQTLRNHADLPTGANVNFYEVGPDQVVRLLTFERGVEDFTLACGTGSGSTALALTRMGILTQQPVCLTMMGGTLYIDVQQEGLFLVGDTNCVAQGELLDEDLEVLYSGGALA